MFLHLWCDSIHPATVKQTWALLCHQAAQRSLYVNDNTWLAQLRPMPRYAYYRFRGRGSLRPTNNHLIATTASAARWIRDKQQLYDK